MPWKDFRSQQSNSQMQGTKQGQELLWKIVVWINSGNHKEKAADPELLDKMLELPFWPFVSCSEVGASGQNISHFLWSVPRNCIFKYAMQWFKGISPWINRDEHRCPSASLFLQSVSSQASVLQTQKGEQVHSTSYIEPKISEHCMRWTNKPARYGILFPCEEGDCFNRLKEVFAIQCTCFIWCCQRLLHEGVGWNGKDEAKQTHVKQRFFKRTDSHSVGLIAM